METTITFAELDTEAVALLPSKETLFWNHYNWAGISASNFLLSGLSHGSLSLYLS